MVTRTFKLAFYRIDKTNSFLSKLIGLWTNSIYCHVELILPGEEWISSRLENGVHVRTGKPKDYKNYDYLELPFTLTDSQYNILKRCLDKQKDAKYDKFGIVLSQIIPLGTQRTDRWFCSELVCKLCQLLYLEEVQSFEPQFTSPQDLYEVFKKYKGID